MRRAPTHSAAIPRRSVAQGSPPSCCACFACDVATADATPATRQALPLTWARLSPPGLLRGGLRLGLGLGQYRGGLLGDARAGEEIRVLRTPQPDRVSESEVAEIGGADHPVLDQLIGFGQRHQHV